MAGRRSGRVFLALLILSAFLLSCGVGRTKKPAAPPEAPDEVVRQLLNAVNNHDVDAAYNRLSAEAQKTISRDQVARLALFSAFAGFQADLDEVDDESVQGDKAEIDLSISFLFRGRTVTQKDVAFLVLEDGAWKLADHFLQTLETGSGIATPPPIAPREFDPNGCLKGDVMSGVWLPSRLKVLDPCVTVEGVVTAVQPPAQGEGDGDLTFDMRVFGDAERLLNDVNKTRRRDTLHVEILPADQDRIHAPVVGERVRLRGAWVTDLAHGHNEIHPAWDLEVVAP